MFGQIHGTQIAVHCSFPKLYCAVTNNMCVLFELHINTQTVTCHRCTVSYFKPCYCSMWYTSRNHYEGLYHNIS